MDPDQEHPLLNLGHLTWTEDHIRRDKPSKGLSWLSRHDLRSIGHTLWRESASTTQSRQKKWSHGVRTGFEGNVKQIEQSKSFDSSSGLNTIGASIGSFQRCWWWFDNVWIFLRTLLLKRCLIRRSAATVWASQRNSNANENGRCRSQDWWISGLDFRCHQFKTVERNVLYDRRSKAPIDRSIDRSRQVESRSKRYIDRIAESLGKLDGSPWQNQSILQQVMPEELFYLKQANNTSTQSSTFALLSIARMKHFVAWWTNQ